MLFKMRKKGLRKVTPQRKHVSFGPIAMICFTYSLQYLFFFFTNLSSTLCINPFGNTLSLKMQYRKGVVLHAKINNRFCFLFCLF